MMNGKIKGTIFDIKEFSIHDGPGGRFTIFLKGCPLKCIWCHNPEGLSPKPQLMHKKNMCTGCGNCMKECNHEDCRSFGRCIHGCANGCLSVSGKEISAVRLAKQIKANADFFDLTDGGVTISGGEPLLQSEFVYALADELGDIHKAIQTSGYADASVYMRVIDKMDYIMQDIKLADRELHKKYTGVYNDVILENIRYLKQSSKQFVFRVPLIPGITDTEENLKAVSKIAEGHQVELLSYNTLAGAKYEMLGMKYPLTITENSKKNYTNYFENARMR